MLVMKKSMQADKKTRAIMLAEMVFQILDDILRRDAQNPPRAHVEYLETLQAIGRCAEASTETRVFAREICEQLRCPAARALGSEAVLRQSIQEALKAWREAGTLLLDHAF